MRIRLLLLAILVLVGGCSGARWTRISDPDRSLEIDSTDCRLISQRMSTERNDFTSSYSMGFFTFKEQKRVSRNAVRQYFNECLYQRGWNVAAGLKKASAGTAIRNGIFAVLDISVSDGATVLSDEIGGLYRIGARQLSPDIEVRLQGKKAGNTVEFVRETISTAAVSTDSREGRNVRSYDKAPKSKLSITIGVRELYEPD